MIPFILFSAISLESLMSPQEKNSTGYNKLSTQEQAALENWIKEKFTKKITGKETVIYLRMNIKGGQELLLENESRWAISPEDQAICKLWILSYPLKIVEDMEGEYPFTLTNLYTLKSVRAKKIP